jgi:uncharacterized membrane protein (DUF106 family)
MNITFPIERLKVEQEEHKQDDRKWHLQREFPLSIILTLGIQTFAMIWSVSSLYSRVDTLVDAFKEMKAERYSREDARRDKEILLTMMQALTQRDADIERRVTTLEARDHAKAFAK